MDDKYIDLLLTKCIDLDKSKILFICYDKEIECFIEKIINKAKNIGIEEFYLEKIDMERDKDILNNHTIEELKQNKYFDSSIWDKYASKYANFLIIDTEQPHIMDDVDSEKIAIMTKQKRESRPIYRKMVEHCELPWCIAAYPGEKWAKEIFPDKEDSYECLRNAIYKVCMIDRDDPIKSWDLQLDKTNGVIKYLNSLDLRILHYQNGLGTDLTIYLPKNYSFDSAKDNNVIVNMPSYEVFASPIYNKTEGIVYSSMPLCYSGAIVEEFWLKFKDGKVIDYGAKKGEKILKEIIETDKNSCYLGECALVENNSPISNLGLIFGTTLIDENASCHLALGSGFPECIENGLGMSDEELLENGVNVSHNHVDFMIGTPDLSIIGTTYDNKEIPIFIDGNFSKDITQKC